MSQYQVGFDLSMHKPDWDLYRNLWNHCKENRVQTFDADLIRENHLADANVDSEGRLNIGTSLARMKYNRLIEVVEPKASVVLANHKRRVNVYRFRGVQPT